MSSTPQKCDFAHNLSMFLLAACLLGTMQQPQLPIKTEAPLLTDGANPCVANQLVVDNDGLHSPEAKTGAIALAAGYHQIRIDWFNKSGGTALKLRYATPGEGYNEVPAAWANTRALKGFIMIKKTLFCAGLAVIVGCSSSSISQAIISFNETLAWAVGLVAAAPAPPAGMPQVVTVTLPGGGTQQAYQPGGVLLIDGNAVLINRLLPLFAPTTSVPDPQNDRGKIFIDGVDTGLKLNSSGLITNAAGVVRDMAIPRGTRDYVIKGPLEASTGGRSLFVRDEITLRFMVPNNGVTTHPTRWFGSLPANSGTTSDVSLQLTVPPYVATAGRVLVFQMGNFGPFGFAPNAQGELTVQLPGGTLPTTIPVNGVETMQILSFELP